MQCLSDVYALFPTFRRTLESGGRGIRGVTQKREKKMLIVAATSQMHFKSEDAQVFSWEESTEQNGLRKATLMPFFYTIFLHSTYVVQSQTYKNGFHFYFPHSCAI